MHPSLTRANLFIIIIIIITPLRHVIESYDVTVTSGSESEMKTSSFEADLESTTSGKNGPIMPTQRRLKERSPNFTNPTQRLPTHKPTHKSSPNPKDIASIACDWEKFNATCPKNEIIIIARARYGRMNLNRCVTKDYGHVGCGDDVTPHMEVTCSGRESCDLSVITLQEFMASCPREFKAYVEVQYHCMPVLPAIMSTTTTTTIADDINAQPDQRFLQQQTQFLSPQYNCPSIDVSKEFPDFTVEWDTKTKSTVAPPPWNARPSYDNFSPYSGFLSSYIWLKAFNSDGNKEPCPWTLSVVPYQRINFTLIDFSLSLGDRRCTPSEKQDGRHNSHQQQARQCHPSNNDSTNNNNNNIIQDCHPYVIFSEKDPQESKDSPLQNLRNLFTENEDDDEEEEKGAGLRSSLLTPPTRGMNYEPKIVNNEGKFKQRESLKKHPPWQAGNEISGRHGNRVHRVCRQDRRESFVYSSTTNVVSVMMVGARYKGLDQYGHFLLKYQVYGCKPLEPPANSWVEYLSVNKAVVICNSTNRSTLFVCSSVTWSGQDVRCPPSVSERASILFVIALGVVVGIIVGIFLLVSVLVYQRKFPIGKLKRRRSTYRTSAELDLVSSAASGFLDDEAIAESVLSNQHVHHLPQNCRLQRFQNCYNEQQHHHHHHHHQQQHKQQQQQQQYLRQQVLHHGMQEMMPTDADKSEPFDLNNEGRMADDVRGCCHHGQPFTLIAATENVPDDNNDQYHHVHLQPFHKEQAFHHHYHLTTMPSQISSCGHPLHYHHHHHHQQLYGSGSDVRIQDDDDQDDSDLKKSKLRDPSDLVRSTLQIIDSNTTTTKGQMLEDCPKNLIDCKDQSCMISNNSG